MFVENIEQIVYQRILGNVYLRGKCPFFCFTFFRQTPPEYNFLKGHLFHFSNSELFSVFMECVCYKYRGFVTNQKTDEANDRILLESAQSSWKSLFRSATAI